MFLYHTCLLWQSYPNVLQRSIKYFIFAALQTEVVAQSVRASDCGSEGRGFNSPQSPLIVKPCEL